jgi:glycine/D-amino acid oxidase-like deaminating enzyme
MPDWTSVKALALKAMENGGKSVSKTTVTWDVARGCANPVWLHHWARNDLSEIDVWDTSHYNATEPRVELRWLHSALRLDVEMTVPCRKCPACLRDRSREWAWRSWSEIRASPRTWFGTITIRPDDHYRFRMLAAVRLANTKGSDLESLPPDEQFRHHEREIYRALQKMFKRLRKAGHRFRFLCVCESSPSHQDGLPHYHVLIHEIGAQIKHEQLAGRRPDRKRGTDGIPCPWPHGFVNIKLVDNDRRAAWYVAKYLSKDAKLKPRPSVRYGREPATVSRIALTT